MAPLETDYLVVGAGAAAMAFVDTLLLESPDARILMVDKRGHVGGHWNDAYSFVRLHQPAAWYGVASRELSPWTKEPRGPNKGMFSLASAPEILAHFEAVLRDSFLASGRVDWRPRTEYLGGEGGTHRLQSLVSGDSLHVRVRRKLVNATHARTEVPATHPPRYSVAQDVRCVPPNEIPRLENLPQHVTVVGSGKTAMDAIIWLLDNGIAPHRVRWIMPRDAWLMNRANFQPGVEGFERGMANSLAQFEAIAQAQDGADLMRLLEQRGVLMRIDPAVQPTTYKCAVVSEGELAQLRRVEDVVRLGRVKALETQRIVLDRGEVEATPDTLYVNCTAGALQHPPKVPVFDADQINILMVRWCQPLFSAALIAWIESHVEGDASRNALCAPVPSPEFPLDWLPMWAATFRNQAAWKDNSDLQGWLAQCRLNVPAVMLKGVAMNPEVKQLLGRVSAAAEAAAAKLPRLMASIA